MKVREDDVEDRLEEDEDERDIRGRGTGLSSSFKQTGGGTSAPLGIDRLGIAVNGRRIVSLQLDIIADS